MIKSELLKLRTLKATPKMMEMARNDKKEMRTVTSSWGWSHPKKAYQYSLFLRCQTLKGYLKIAFFDPKQMRCGSNMPVFELFISKKAGQFLTYDRANQKWSRAMVHNLDLPDKEERTERWINPEGAKTIKQYLGVDEPVLRGVRAYQEKIREDDLIRSYRRETDPWDLELKQTPQLPKDWKKWVAKTAIQENYIFYDYEKSGAKTGYCSFCEKTVPITQPRHNQKGKCKCCGKPITFKANGKNSKVESKKQYVYLIQRTESGFVIREFQAQKYYVRGKNWVESVWTHESRRSFFDKGARPLSAYYWGVYRNREVRFVKSGICSIGWCGVEKGKVYGRTIPSLSQSELLHTGLPEYMKRIDILDPEKYLAIWNRYHQLEQLVKAGLHALVDECVDSSSKMDEAHSGKAGGLAKQMRIDEQRLKRLRKNNGGLFFLRWLRYEKKNSKSFPDEMICWFSKNGVDPGGIGFIRDRMSDLQIYNYIRRQMVETGMKCQEVITTWKDYLSMAKKYKLDVNDAIVYRASKLKQRHDELVIRGKRLDLEAEAKKEQRKYPHVEQILHEIKEIYSFQGEEYSVVVPDGIVDIMIEGQNLSHCVGSSERYYDRIERQESYIMFLRKTKTPEQSYYTLEVEPGGTIRQKRTMFDRQHPDVDQATRFLKQWQKEVSKRLTEQQRKLAEKSKQLRTEGFEQMRRDRVIINAGELRGRMLVDVLMADLMENQEEKTA